jgi:hypothetical protein
MDATAGGSGVDQRGVDGREEPPGATGWDCMTARGRMLRQRWGRRSGQKGVAARFARRVGVEGAGEGGTAAVGTGARRACGGEKGRLGCEAQRGGGRKGR